MRFYEGICMNAIYTPGQEAFAKWRRAVENREAPVVIRHCFDQPTLIPGHVVLLGGAPGAGKTAFTMQVVVEALRNNPDKRVLVANCEMSAEALLDRQLTRLAGIAGETVRHRRFNKSHQERLDAGLATIDSIADRIAFLQSPFSVANVMAGAVAHRADIVVVDYIQRFSSDGGEKETRLRLARVMDDFRKMASLGFVVIALSAVGRSKDDKGRASYGGLSLASFRESSEIEFGADDALILAPVASNKPGTIVLNHLKCRHGQPTDLHLRFDRKHQSFSIRKATDWSEEEVKEQVNWP
jgi:replicative DNA helicase